MHDEEIFCSVKKNTYGLPNGTTVSYWGKVAKITDVFPSPQGNGPQYRLEYENGGIEKSVHQGNVEWVADPKPASKFNIDDRVQYTSWTGKHCVGKVTEYRSAAHSYYTVELESGMVTKVGEASLSLVPEDPQPVVTFQKGDRVKFRHNGKCGTVVHTMASGVYVDVKYDGGSTERETPKNLTLLHSPAAKAAEGPHPMQKAIDFIQEERRVVSLQIEDLQRRSRELKKAKELLIRGV